MTKKLTDANYVPTLILLYRIKGAAALRLSLTLLYCERRYGRMKEKHVLAKHHGDNSSRKKTPEVTASAMASLFRVNGALVFFYSALLSLLH